MDCVECALLTLVVTQHDKLALATLPLNRNPISSRKHGQEPLILPTNCHLARTD